MAFVFFKQLLFFINYHLLKKLITYFLLSVLFLTIILLFCCHHSFLFLFAPLLAHNLTAVIRFIYNLIALRRPYRLRQPAAFDVEKKEYLCPLCERLCNTALPLLPGPALPTRAPPTLTEEVYNDAVNLILKLKHQVCSEQVHICTEFCEEMHCQARARSVGAMSSDMEDGDSADESEVYVSTHSENLLPSEFLVHFEGEVQSYNDTTKSLIEDFASVSTLFYYLTSIVNADLCLFINLVHSNGSVFFTLRLFMVLEAI